MLEPALQWQRRAKCRGDLKGAERFFPNTRAQSVESKKFCTGCQVIDQCRTYAVAHGSYGIWGGTSTADREKIPPEMVDLIRENYIKAGLYENGYFDREERELVVVQLPVLLDPIAQLVFDLDAIQAQLTALQPSYIESNTA